MKVLLATDIRVCKLNNKLYLPVQTYTIIKRYYDFFGKIILYSRLNEFDDNQELYEITHMIDDIIVFNNFFDVLTNKKYKILIKAVCESDLVIGRFHSFAACQVSRLAKKIGRPFLAEVMGDAFEAFWNHGILGKIIAPYIEYNTKIAIGRADYGLYVTEQYLQKKYPCNGKIINASNVKINNNNKSTLEKRMKRLETMDYNNISLMTTAAVDVESKGQKYVIEALPILNKLGILVTYYLVGGGDNSTLKNIANKLGVTNQIIFLGRLRNIEVLEKLQAIDIYIQPSLQEGLPRAVIEAMSVGCLCLGARTAGIPELLDEECIFDRKSSKAIANSILKVLSSDKKSIVKRNFNKSKEYLEDVLDARRKKFFEEIRNDLARSVKR